MASYPFFKRLAGFFGLGSFVKDWDTVKALMDSEQDALALVAPDGVPVYINKAGKAFFKASSLLQSVLNRVIDDESNRLALAKLEAAVKNRLAPDHRNGDRVQQFRHVFGEVFRLFPHRRQ